MGQLVAPAVIAGYGDGTAVGTVFGLSLWTIVAVAVVLVLVIAVGLAVWYRSMTGRPGTLGSRSSSHSQDGRDPTGDTPTPPESEPEPASDEDRIIQLLRDNDGRMKQTRIVDETDWSKSKVSMLLSEMEEQGLINKLPVGRENLISLPGEEPDAVGTAYDDE